MRLNIQARRVIALAAGLALHACTTAPPQAVKAPTGTARFAIDVDAAVSALATKQNRTWQDSTFDSSPRVRAAIQAAGSHHYEVKTVGVTYAHALGAACSSAPAYLKVDVQNSMGPNPQSGDYIFTILDTGVLQKMDPATQVVTSLNLGDTFSKTAVMVSGDNRRIYVTSRTGTLYVVDAAAMTLMTSLKISNAGFTGMSPMIDYSNGGGFPLGSDENVICMASDGSIYRVRVQRASVTGVMSYTCNAWTSSNGTDQSASLAAWSTKVNIPYGAAVTPGASPVSWSGKSYFGNTTGTFYEVSYNYGSPASAPTLRSWDLTPYSSAPAPNGKACSASPALDYDNSLNVIAIFAPVGERVCWIDPSQPTTAKIYDSPPLVVDKKPAAATQYMGKLSSFPYTTASTTYTLADFEAVAAKNPPSPSRWGNGGATTPFGAAVSCATIKECTAGPLKGDMWVGQQSSPRGIVQSLDLLGNVTGNFQDNSNSFANVGEIAFDDSGNCFASYNNGALSGSLPDTDMFDQNGNYVRTFTYPGNKNVVWPQPDHAGHLWVTSAAGSLAQFDTSTGAVTVPAISYAGAFALAVDASNNVYCCSQSSNTIKEFSSTGTLLKTFNLPAGAAPTYLAFEPATGYIWVAENGKGQLQAYSPVTGLAVNTVTGITKAWTLAFDPLSGLLWAGNEGTTNRLYRINPAVGASPQIQLSYGISGNPSLWEVAVDGNGDPWVSASSGTYKVFDFGDLSDLFASDGYFGSGDGDDSYIYLKYKIPSASFAGKIPTGASIAMSYSAPAVDGKPENFQLYRAEATRTDGTLWQGYKVPANVNMDYNNRATLYDSFAYASLSSVTPVVTGTGGTTGAGTANFNLGMRHPTDAINSPDGTNSEWCYAVRSTGKALKNVAHFYSPNSTNQPGAGQTLPVLTVSLANAAALPSTNGLECQPCVDSVGGHVYVLGSNCMFELPYNAASPDDFSNPAKVCYNLTQAGRTGGPVAGGKYLYEAGNVQQNFYGDLFVTDADTSNVVYVNRFSTPFDASPTVDHLQANFSAGAGTQAVQRGMLWDYDKGSVYFVTGNNNLVRGSLY